MRMSSVSVVSSFVHLPVPVHSPASKQRFIEYSATWWRETKDEEGQMAAKDQSQVRLAMQI